MIVSKPKVGTLFSLGIFITLCFLLSGYAIRHIFSGDAIAWYHYTLAILFFPIGLGLFLRLLLGYRIVKVGKQKIEINFPTRFKHRSYSLKEIRSWQETEVKTVSGTFKEMEVQFTDNNKIALSIQEHTDYVQVRNYLQKKCSKFKRK